MTERHRAHVLPALTKSPRRGRASGRLVVAFALSAILASGYLYADDLSTASACSSVSFVSHKAGRGLRVAEKIVGPWYGRGVPSISDQIRPVTGNLFPGASGQMVAYVKNVGSNPGAVSVAFDDLADSGGAFTEPERELQRRRDAGDLSANITLTLTYASSLRPSEQHVVADGTLRELAARGRVLTAPIPLQPHSARGSEIGIWRIGLSVPASADNRIQGDKAACSVVFGLAQAR